MMTPRKVMYKPEIVSFISYEDCPKGTLLFGGNYNWRRKVLAKNSHIKGIELSQHFDTRVINKNTPMILINTDSIGHGLYQRICSKVKTLPVKIAYINRSINV